MATSPPQNQNSILAMSFPFFFSSLQLPLIFFFWILNHWIHPNVLFVFWFWNMNEVKQRGPIPESVEDVKAIQKKCQEERRFETFKRNLKQRFYKEEVAQANEKYRTREHCPFAIHLNSPPSTIPKSNTPEIPRRTLLTWRLLDFSVHSWVPSKTDLLAL